MRTKNQHDTYQGATEKWTLSSVKLFSNQDRMVATEDFTKFIESYDLDYHGLRKKEANNLCNSFIGRSALLITKLNETKANSCEIATAENAIYTRSLSMVEYAPGFSCALDKNGVPKAFRVDKFEFLPSDLSEKELEFVRSWFKHPRNGRCGWMDVAELVLSFHFDFPVRIKGNYPKSVAIYLYK
ncbi:MAG: hypothetical protein IJY59_02325 [Bacteroidaceae bacterium]|nr:hypothetical protein [Bacteroidaceae bacterium]